jgi:hypothetical protein
MMVKVPGWVGVHFTRDGGMVEKVLGFSSIAGAEKQRVEHLLF